MLCEGWVRFEPLDLTWLLGPASCRASTTRCSAFTKVRVRVRAKVRVRVRVRARVRVRVRVGCRQRCSG